VKFEPITLKTILDTFGRVPYPVDGVRTVNYSQAARAMGVTTAILYRWGREGVPLVRQESFLWRKHLKDTREAQQKASRATRRVQA
jgi:hypothetical protein